MGNKPWKTIIKNDGKIEIFSNHYWEKIDWWRPPWYKRENLEVEKSFIYKGRRFFLSEFMAIDNHPSSWIKEFDGYMNDSFFSGKLIKLSKGGRKVQIHTFISS